MLMGQNFKVISSGCPNSDNIMRNGVLLPLHHGLTEEMLARFRSQPNSLTVIHNFKKLYNSTNELHLTLG